MRKLCLSYWHKLIKFSQRIIYLLEIIHNYNYLNGQIHDYISKLIHVLVIWVMNELVWMKFESCVLSFNSSETDTFRSCLVHISPDDLISCFRWGIYNLMWFIQIVFSINISDMWYFQKKTQHTFEASRNK